MANRRYSGLAIIVNHHSRLDGELAIFKEIAAGETFMLRPIIGPEFVGGSPQFDANAMVFAVIKSIRANQSRTGLLIELDVRAVPEKMRAGKYTLEFDTKLVCMNLPSEMFK